ncbi:MAG TPA: leucyl aminopeptidase [Anaerolineae bacterium]|nr:leucyl aminopeptidase [Anaerolineae bacterium]
MDHLKPIVTVTSGGIQTTQADAIIVNLFEGVTQPAGATGVVNQALAGAIAELIQLGDFQGKLGETAVLYPRGAIPARRVIVVGLGPAKTFDLEGVREASGAAIKQARTLGAAHVATIIHGGGLGGLDLTAAAQAVVEGSLLALYRYNAPGIKQAEKKKEAHQIEQLTLIEFDAGKIAAIQAGATSGEAIAAAVWLARDLVNQPSNVATPRAIVAAAEAMAAEVGLACRVLDEAALRQEGMNLFLAVTQGASEPTKFLILEHKPEGATERRPIVLIGKGVTFDTGGHDLKILESMVRMKGDMAGAAAVIGTLQVAATLGLPRHIIGLAPLGENRLSDTAYKPSDVFTAKNGVSVEVTSPDSEGRLLLADSLCYADSLQPEAVIDVATLTAGKMYALGYRTSALFATDDHLSEALLAAGQKGGEPLWRLPLDPAYDRQLASEVADVKNEGGKWGSAVNAARFLTHFVADWPWAHLDIAAGEFYDDSPWHTPRSYLTAGATGLPLRTLVEFLRSRS